MRPAPTSPRPTPAPAGPAATARPRGPGPDYERLARAILPLIKERLRREREGRL